MTTTADELRDEVRAPLRGVRAGGDRGTDGCGCGSGVVLRRRRERRARSSARRCTTPSSAASSPTRRALASLGCGNPTAVADLHEGETVLDLGSGGGIDVILSAKRVGPTGTAYGLDMTDEMLALAQQNAARGRRRERALPEGRDRGDPAAGGLGRRRHLELRDQPLDRQGGGADRDRARAQARRAHRRSATSSPKTSLSPAERAERGSLRRLHRGRALEGRVRGRARGGRLRARLRSSSPTRSPTACTARSSRRRRLASRSARAAGDPARGAGGLLLMRSRCSRCARRRADRHVRARLRRRRRDHGRREDACARPRRRRDHVRARDHGR